jgi:hypothetical protein
MTEFEVGEIEGGRPGDWNPGEQSGGGGSGEGLF